MSWKNGTQVALQVGEDLSTYLFLIDAAFDFAPPKRGTNGGARAELLVLSNREMSKDYSPKMWKQRQD
jgi:hypothetical protein